jgi:hypothetical protein
LLNSINHCFALFAGRAERESSQSSRGRADFRLILLNVVGALFRIAALLAVARLLVAAPVAWAQAWQVGAEKFGGPVAIQASVSGTGDSSTNGVVSFDPQKEQQRPGLLLQNGQVSIGWASYCDARPYHGWVIAYNASNLTQQAGVFNDTPNGYQGGIWMSAGGLAGDANFNTFVATGNGDYDGNTEFGDSIVKLSPPIKDSFAVADWFTPWDQLSMNGNDGDLGSGGVLLLPDLPAGSPHQHLLVEAGKEGTIYVVDRDNMGKFCSTCNGGDSQIVQELEKVLLNALMAAPAYWKGNVYFAYGVHAGISLLLQCGRQRVAVNQPSPILHE